MNEPIQQPKTNQPKEKESDDSSRSPGVTDRGLGNPENSLNAEVSKQSAQQNQTKSSEIEDNEKN
jgi:hypothetical protein